MSAYSDSVEKLKNLEKAAAERALEREEKRKFAEQVVRDEAPDFSMWLSELEASGITFASVTVFLPGWPKFRIR